MSKNNFNIAAIGLLLSIAGMQAYQMLGEPKNESDTSSLKTMELAKNKGDLQPPLKKEKEYSYVNLSDFIESSEVDAGIFKEAQKEALDRGLPSITHLRKTPVDGILEAYTDKGVFYITSDFKYSFNGDLVRNEDKVNLTVMSNRVRTIEQDLTSAANSKYTWDFEAKNKEPSQIRESKALPLENLSSEDIEIHDNEIDKSALDLLRNPKENSAGITQAIDVSATNPPKSILDEGYIEEYKAKMRARIESRMSKTSQPSSSSHAMSSNNSKEVKKETLNLSQIQKGNGFVEYKGTVLNKVGFDKKGRPLSAENTKEQVMNLYKKVEGYGDKWSVVYPAKGEEKGGVVVFSDPTCGVCKRLHRQIDEMNDRGLTVRVLMYPRALVYGADDKDASRVLETLEAIWCSTDPAKTMHDVYSGKRIKESDCSIVEEQGRSNFPVKEHYFLGLLFGIKGTPLSFTSEGVLISGFGSADSYLKRVGIE